MTLWKLTLSYAVYIKLHNKYFKIPSRFRKFHYNFWQAKHNFYSVISKPSSTKRPQTEATQPNHPFVCRHITNSHLTPSKTIHQTKIKYLSKTHTTTEAAERDGPRHCDTSLFDMEHHIGDDNSWFPANRTIIYVMACDTESDYTKKNGAEEKRLRNVECSCGFSWRSDPGSFRWWTRLMWPLSYQVNVHGWRLSTCHYEVIWILFRDGN